jgi:hypothetical protein
MRKFVLDEISRSDIQKIREYLKEAAVASEVEGLYWVELHEDVLSGEQCEHQACKPYRFAVEVCETSVSLEMLIRSAVTMRCDCIKYATSVQRDFILRFGDTLIENCKIRT